MNESGDIPLAHSSTPDARPCGLISIIPTLGMSSCRGRAEAFARRLSSKLRTLGSQTDDDPTSQEDEPIINGGTANTWMPSHDSDQSVTDLQPLRHESDSFFDFDCELESPGSPVDECEYLRLIETASNTPHNSAAESGYVCASTASSQNSSDGPYFDVENTEINSTLTEPPRTTLPAAELPEYVNSLKLNGSASATERLSNGHDPSPTDSDHTITASVEDDQKLDLTVIDTSTSHAMRQEDSTSIKLTGELPQKLLSNQEMVNVQDQIINELQKQSDQITDQNAVICTESETRENGSQTDVNVDASTVAISTDMVDSAPTTESIPQIIHTITNGHSEDGDEVLHIEMTESIATSTPKKQDIKDQTPEQEEKTTDDVKEQTQDESQSITTEDCEKLPQKEEPSRTHQSVLDTDDEDDCRPQRVRRCSSLKTGKTPPGTPGRKKIVRFADVLGLDLADVKTFLDEIPTIPKSAFEDLEVLESEPPIQLGPKSDKLLMPLFQQPGGLPTFLDIVREKQVSLENAAISDPINQTITGSVRVRNLDFHKSVHIRYTLDGWRSFADLQANYAKNSCDGFSDKFTFVLFGNSLQIGQRLEFAVRFQCKGQQFWDNNYGANYCFQCLPTTTNVTTPITTIVPSHHASNSIGLLSPTAGDAWCSSFY